MKRTLVVPLILLALATIAAVGIIRLTNPEPIEVALVTHFGSGSFVGSSEVNAGILFTEETPGSLISIVTLDDQFDPVKTRQLVSKARAEGVQFFITSHPSNCAVGLVEQFADSTQALMLVTASTTDRLTGRDDGILRVVADVIWEQREIARYVAASAARTILVVQDTGNRPYTDPAYQVFSQELASTSNYRISRLEMLVSQFRPEDLESFLAGSADLLYVLAGSYQPAIGAIAQLFHLKHPHEPIILTPWSRSPAILEAAGPAADRIVLPSHYPSRYSDTAVASYYARFRARFGYEPTSMSIGVRQSLELLDRAFREGRRSPEEVKRYLLDHSPFTTSLGPVVFDRYGDAASVFHYITDLRKEYSE
jgi:ABC-type branched-subunit amino acid transport system substrate-binding protein